MHKLIILPHPAVFSGFTQPSNTAVARLEGPATQDIQPRRARSTRELLEHRRRSLVQFGNMILNKSPLAVSALREKASSMAGVANIEDTVPLPECKVLESVGALIVDEDAIDRVALERTGLAKVLDNVIVSLVTPVTVNPVVGAPPAFWHHQNVNVAAARNKNLDGTGVLVGVLDSGIDAGHPEFAGKAIAGNARYFQEFNGNGDEVQSAAHDADAHGTHVCGLIVGRQAGLAPGAELAVACVLTTPGANGPTGRLAQTLAGFHWLLTAPFRGSAGDQGVDIMNASFGEEGYQNFWYDTLANARQNPGTGLIAAIGNDGFYGPDNHSSPGSYDIVLGIGAVDQGNNVASFSDWGTSPQNGVVHKPDLSAPGVDVVSSVPWGGYAAMSGTSMAAPIVTGAAALLLQQNPHYSFNVPGLFGRLLKLVRPLNANAPVNQIRGGAGALDLSGI